MRCPKCSGKMWPAEVQGYTVDQCADCAGVLVQPETVARVLASKTAAFDPGSLLEAAVARDSAYLCPICRHTLDAYRVRGVEVEACPECMAIFFDAGEVATVRERLRSRDLGRVIVDADPEGILELVFVLIFVVIGEIHEYYRTKDA